MEPQRPLSFSLGEALGLLCWPRDRAERLWDGRCRAALGSVPPALLLPGLPSWRWRSRAWVPLVPVVAAPVLASKCRFTVTPPTRPGCVLCPRAEAGCVSPRPLPSLVQRPAHEPHGVAPFHSWAGGELRLRKVRCLPH